MCVPISVEGVGLEFADVRSVPEKRGLLCDTASVLCDAASVLCDTIGVLCYRGAVLCYAQSDAERHAVEEHVPSIGNQSYERS
jgi:methenyltetrahydromethanopterin cyclohydrolase